jgi:predicted permease
MNRCTQLRIFALHDQAEARLTALARVVGVSSILVPPFLGPSVFMTKVVSDRQTQNDGVDNPWFGFDAVGPDFFRTFGLPILQGRAFTSADRDDAPGVAIVTEGVARHLWPGEDAVGRRFGGLGVSDPDSLVTVVGVVPDVHYREHRLPTPTIYRPYRQTYAQGIFTVRTRGTLQTVLPELRAAMHDIDPELMITKAETMDELIAPELARPRLEMLLLSAFALTASVLAAIGLYGIMAQAVAQRNRELGVRMALGATAEQLRRMVLRQAIAITLAGSVAGLAGALAGSRVLKSLLFQVSPADPATLVGVSILLLAVALLASYLPAHRATRIDPAAALRTE